MAGMFQNFPNIDYHDLNLDWILKRIREVVNVANTMTEWRKTHEKEYKDLKAQVDALEKWIKDFNDGNIPESILDGLKTWIDKNLEDLISRAVKFVWFGLTHDGHFVAYIPDSWSELTFDTVMNFANEYYGHLLICYDDKKLAEAETYYGSNLNKVSSLYWAKSELQPYGG